MNAACRGAVSAWLSCWLGCAGGDRDRSLDAGDDDSSLPAELEASVAPVLVDAGTPDGSLVREAPRLPVGYAAFRELERLPVVRINQRTYMRSTYDRSGRNETADASHFLRQERSDFNVALDVSGPGTLAFFRTNHWHGSPWHYVVDGRDIVVQESTTSDPTRPVANSVFLPARAFPPLLTYTWSITRGADLSWVSVPFQRSFTLAYGRTHYGTGYYIYHAFPEHSENLPEPIHSFSELDEPPSDVIELLSRAGEDIAPNGAATQREEGTFLVAAHQSRVFASLVEGPRTVRKLELSVPRGAEQALGRARLRVTWDDAELPQIDAPIALFFGTGTLYNRDQREYLVKGLLASVRFAERVVFSSYFPMPYGKSARFEVVAAAEPIADVRFMLSSEPSRDPPGLLGQLHATYVDIPEPVRGHDMVLLDTTKVEGGGHAYCGLLAGMSFTFSDRGWLPTLEGDPRFFFDDSKTPQAHATGSEEWGGGGDYWGGQTMTLPLAGHPVGAPLFGARNAEDAIQSAYRFLVSDAMPFGKNARIQLEHGGENDSTEHYRAVTYWYGVKGACLVQTDSLHVGDEADEEAHAYSSPEASDVQTLTSRYEWGVDTLSGKQIYPAETDTGRYTRGTSELTLAISPNNVGVLLRRKLDYGFADQRAEVFVAKDEPGAPFVTAGVWYLAGSNRCLFSNPPGELDPPRYVEQESNRRFRDDEFLLPPRLTRGLSKIRLRFRFVGGAKPLRVGGQPPLTAWSEYRYTAYSYVLPDDP